MRELDAKALLEKLDDKLLEVKAETLGYTFGHVYSGGIVDTGAHTLAEVEVEKPADSLCDVKALPLVDVLACILDTE